MKPLVLTTAFALGITFGASETQAQDRHFESGTFALKPGDAADLTEDHIPLVFIKVWPHPFGDRAINISVNGRSYSLGTGGRIDLKSPYSGYFGSGKAENALSRKDHCNLDIVDFNNPKEGTPKVTFGLDCGPASRRN